MLIVIFDFIIFFQSTESGTYILETWFFICTLMYLFTFIWTALIPVKKSSCAAVMAQQRFLCTHVLSEFNDLNKSTKCVFNLLYLNTFVIKEHY